ncbi:MAG: peptide ABC transporter ATP-binding protein [Acidiferrobacteraceae bacterium]|nr:peptide ABC transporter ATP-binding protein [Acidiferrobacteraceae bacterium]
MSRLLEIEDLSVRYRMLPSWRAAMQSQDPYLNAVCGVSFAIEEGQSFALVGESGSGKSTLARAIMGIEKAHSGSIRFQGHELRGLSKRGYKSFRRNMSMMFQDPAGSLSPRLTVKRLITEPFLIHQIRNTNIEDEAIKLLQMVGLGSEFLNRYPHQLSGGQARRVGVARALALSPKLLVADEPTAGLDVSVQGEVLNLLLELQQQQNISVLIITHNLNVVLHFADRMAIMYLGRFIEQGAAQEIFLRPRHPYTQALLSSSPEPDPDSKGSRIELKGEVSSNMDRPAGCEFHPRCPIAQSLCTSTAPRESSADHGHSFSCHYPVAIFNEN